MTKTTFDLNKILAEAKEMKCKVQFCWSRDFLGFSEKKGNRQTLFLLPFAAVSRRYDDDDVITIVVEIAFIKVLSKVSVRKLVQLAFVFIFVLFIHLMCLLLMLFNPQFHRSGRKYGFIMDKR